VLESIAKLGLEERRVRLAEAQGLIVLGIIQNVLGDLSLTPAQHEIAATAVPARLRAAVAAEAEPSFAGRGEPVLLSRKR
jgi:hypothetical protein